MKEKTTLYKPTENVLRSFVNLDNNPSFTLIMEWLSDCLLSMSLNSTTTKDSTERLWNDGQCQAIKLLLSIKETAKNQMNEILKGKIQSERSGSVY